MFIILRDVCTSDIKFGLSYTVEAFGFLGFFGLFGVLVGRFIFVCFSSRDMQSPVGKTWLACYDLAMIIPLSWRNLVMIKPGWRHGSRVSWHVRQDSWHVHGVITMFSMIHTMIMVWSSCFSCFFFQKMDCLSMFSPLVAGIYHYIAHLTGCSEI